MFLAFLLATGGGAVLFSWFTTPLATLTQRMKIAAYGMATLGLALFLDVATSGDMPYWLVLSKFIFTALIGVMSVIFFHWESTGNASASSEVTLSVSSNSSLISLLGDISLPPDVVEQVHRIFSDMAQKDAANLRLASDAAERNRLLTQSRELYEAACMRVLLLFQNSFPSLEGDAPFTIRLYDAIPNLSHVVFELFEVFREGGEAGPAFTAGYSVWRAYERNGETVSYGLLSEPKYNRGDRVTFWDYLRDHEATREMAVRKYLGGTHFRQFFMRDVPYRLPDNLRTEHTVIVARSGGGKSQLLEALILHDLNQPDPPSIIVIDSKAGKADLFQRVAQLDVFHPDHGRLRDRLIMIDPKEKPPLNIFDVDRASIAERANDIVASVRYFIDNLLANELTGQMRTLLNPLMQMMVRIDGATLHTLIRAIRDPYQWPNAINDLPEGARNFMLNDYNSEKGGYGQTKIALSTRINEILTNDELGSVFGAKNNTIDLADTMNKGKVILISTEYDYLHDNSPLFGRYFISRILAAARQRNEIPREERKRVHVYVDECKPYTDDKLEEVFNTIRSYGVGMTVAYQDVGQMSTHTNGIMGSTTIRITGELKNPSDRVVMAKHMEESKPDFIAAQRVEVVPANKDPTYADFAVFVSEPPGAQSAHLRFGQLDRAGLMSQEDYDRVRARNRDWIHRRDDDTHDDQEPDPPAPPQPGGTPPPSPNTPPPDDPYTNTL
jgi:hypothetical protein